MRPEHFTVRIWAIQLKKTSSLSASNEADWWYQLQFVLSVARAEEFAATSLRQWPVTPSPLLISHNLPTFREYSAFLTLRCPESSHLSLCRSVVASWFLSNASVFPWAINFQEEKMKKRGSGSSRLTVACANTAGRGKNDEVKELRPQEKAYLPFTSHPLPTEVNTLYLQF